MLRRFFKLIAGSLLTLVGIAIVIEAIRFNQPTAMHSTTSNSWDPISEFLLCVGVVVGGYGAYLAYSGWDPEAAEKFVKENSRISPSPGTPGEGRGEGSISTTNGTPQIANQEDPHPNPSTPRSPRQREYRAREPEEQSPPPPDIGVQP